MLFDFRYLCDAIGNLSGIPIRYFEGDKLVHVHSMTPLPKDPMNLYHDYLWAIRDHVGYFVTPLFHYYGVVNTGTVKLVIGPTCQIQNGRQALRDLAFQADVPADNVEDFIQAIQSITSMPLESLLQMLCVLNYVLNGEMQQIGDIAIYESEQHNLNVEAQERKMLNTFEPEAFAESHNTYSIEQTLMSIIRKGDSAALQQWVSRAPAVRSGVLAGDQLRQLRNTFIVSATLASRSAIAGGVDVNEAFSMSDAYIQRCETLNSPDKIMNLTYHMMLEYTSRVERVRAGRHTSRLATQVAGYVHRHLSEPISTEAIAKELYMSRTHLSARFRKETGETLTNFITKEKTEEAKRLLRYTNKSMTAISSYLGFSSPGHFANVFKKIVGITPSDYREKFDK